MHNYICMLMAFFTIFFLYDNTRKNVRNYAPDSFISLLKHGNPHLRSAILNIVVILKFNINILRRQWLKNEFNSEKQF